MFGVVVVVLLALAVQFVSEPFLCFDLKYVLNKHFASELFDVLTFRRQWSIAVSEVLLVVLVIRTLISVK